MQVPPSPARSHGGRFGLGPVSGRPCCLGTGLGQRQQTPDVELRVRRESDLDACEHLAHVVHALDGYPPRCADDLRHFVSAPDALSAWVAQSEKGIVGHVALQPRSSRCSFDDCSTGDTGGGGTLTVGSVAWSTRCKAPARHRQPINPAGGIGGAIRRIARLATGEHDSGASTTTR